MRKKGYGFNKYEHMVIKVILTIARQITDMEERKDFVSRVRLYDNEGNEIPLFLKQLDRNKL